MNDNPLLPHLGKLMEVRDLAADIKLFRVEMQNGDSEAFRAFQPGQFAFVSAFGQGEAPFGIANTCGRGPLVEFAVARLGSMN
jgi:sulfhydrogenase subunit gamma (sulfur reductase)